MRKIVFIYISIIFIAAGALRASENTNFNAEKIIVAAERDDLYLPLLRNKRVGLLVNPTSMVGSQHIVDFLLSKKINIKMIFAPEHGFRGDKGAGEMVLGGRDKKTNVPIVSLHGKIKKPNKSHMQQLDILVFDIQDVGVRYYTYISSMHYLMEACAENNVPLIVLDRPNPNGDYIDGPILQPQLKSFVGMHPIPIVHGLTVGELAKMINGQGWLSGGIKCDLTVIKVKNYTHDSTYSLPIKPSSNLPNDLSISLYPSLAFFEATPVSVGRGTPWPFQVLGYPNKMMGEFSFIPKSITGSWSQLNHAGKRLYGQKITSDRRSKKTENTWQNQGIDLSYILAWKKHFDEEGMKLITRPSFMDKLSGTIEFKMQVLANMSARKIKLSWQRDLRTFQIMRRKYLLYKDSSYMTRFE